MNTFPPSETGKNRAVTARLRVARLLGSARGSALVISLVFIILITIAIVGFVTTATLERKTVQSHYGRVQAALYNTMAVDVVASRISQATTGTSTWWVSQPGRIAYTPFATTATAPATTFVDLSSGKAGSTAVENESVDLNPASLTQGTGLIASDTAISLPVKWIYVRKDGSQVAAPPTYDRDNPWVGRYAYWTDDESSRVNVNTALSNTALQIDLTTFSPLNSSDVLALKTARKTRLFNSLEELKSVADSTNIASAVTTNKMALTHFNQSPELNRFGDPRIVLTTQKSLAGGLPFLDILNADNADPGINDNLDPVKVQTLFTKLTPYFSKRTCDWGLPGPVTYNKTLANKYGPTGAAQIIVNLIDYVRSAESSQPLILPLRAAADPTTGALTYNVSGAAATGNYGPNALRGNSRRLHIVEMGVWVPATPAATVKLKVKIFRDAGTGPDVSLAGLPLQYTVSSPSMSFSSNSYLIPPTDILKSDLTLDSPTIGPGEYRTVTINVTTPVATRPTTVAMRLAIKNYDPVPNKRFSYDIAPIQDSDKPGGYAQYAQCTVDPDPAVGEAAMTSISTDDPVINQCFVDWRPLVPGSPPGSSPGPQGINTFGTQDRPLVYKFPRAAITVPGQAQQDTDSGGNLTDASTAPPSIKASLAYPDGTLGIVASVGEIGRVHSGGRGTYAFGTPWRTLRLQPRSTTGTVPDWMLLDLFTVPIQSQNLADQAVFRPSSNTLGGRVDVNGKPQLYPFSLSQVSRDVPLLPIIQSGNASLSLTEAKADVQNILNKTLAASTTGSGAQYGNSDLISNALYLMPGEICEVKGIADSGEQSEALVRNTIGLLTTQSNVFLVFSVGQKIQQLPNGQIKVLGEVRTRTLLERYEDLTVPWKAGGTWKMRELSTTELGI